MSISNYAENKILEHTTGTTAWTMPTDVYVKLHTGDPGEAATSNAAGKQHVKKRRLLRQRLVLLRHQRLLNGLTLLQQKHLRIGLRGMLRLRVMLCGLVRCLRLRRLLLVTLFKSLH